VVCSYILPRFHYYFSGETGTKLRSLSIGLPTPESPFAFSSYRHQDFTREDISSKVSTSDIEWKPVGSSKLTSNELNVVRATGRGGVTLVADSNEVTRIGSDDVMCEKVVESTEIITIR